VDKAIAVVWDRGPVEGRVEVIDGTLDSGQSSRTFRAPQSISPRLEVRFGDARVAAGAHPTMAQIHCEKSPITVMVRDVSSSTPIWVPEYGVAVTEAGDSRTYAQIVKSVKAKKLRSGLQRIESEPEETFAGAAAHNLDMQCPVWLAVPRDMRMFRFSHEERFGYWGFVQPIDHSFVASLAEAEGRDYAYHFVLGPGSSCRSDITRRLDDGVLPIVRSEQVEGDVSYSLTAFATLETQPLSPGAVRGTGWVGGYAFTGGNMYSEQDRLRLKAETEAETAGREEQTVCCIRVTATNTGRVPRYAWFKALKVSVGRQHVYDGDHGYSALGPERVYGVHLLDGAPMPQQEMAVLLQPAACATLEIRVPHRPVSAARAAALAQLRFDEHLDACRAFWRSRLEAGATITVPEKAIDERIRAGLLHLDINSIGREPDGAVMACVGWYSPIGSESAPMIQFYDSMGWHSLAERCLEFFFEHQRDDGFIQNFGGYQLETGPFLWTCGEHYRYTRDTGWVRRVKQKLLRSCGYLLYAERALVRGAGARGRDARGGGPGRVETPCRRGC